MNHHLAVVMRNVAQLITKQYVYAKRTTLEMLKSDVRKLNATPTSNALTTNTAIITCVE